MGDHAPRDMSEWMSSVERRLRSANNAAVSVPRSYNEALQTDIAADKVRHPTAPVEITYQSAIYTADGLAREYARLMVDFPDVTKATDGSDIPIREYELWGRNDTTNFLDATTDAAPGLAAPGLTVPSLASTPAMKAAANPPAPFKRLAVSDESSLRLDRLYPGAIWTFKVRAIGQYTTAPGDFSPEFQTQLLADTTPPEQPTAPDLTVKGSAIIVRWDGQSVTGAMPGDLDYVVVAAGDASSPITQIDTFPAGGGLMVIPNAPYYIPQFVRFQAVDLSGNRSPWSVQSTAYATPLVDADVILAAIDGATTIISNLGSEALNDGVVLSSKLAENAVTQAKIAANAVAAGQIDAPSVAAAVGTFVEIDVSQLNATTASIDTAVVNKLWTDVVNSRKITTDMLVVTGENMMWNGYGQTLDNSSWLLWGYDTADKPAGTYGSFTVTTQTTRYLAGNQPIMPVEENTAYVFEGWVKASVAGSVCYIESMETGGTDPAPRYILNNYAVPTVWTRFSVPVTTSVGQTGMQFRMFANHVNGTVTNATQKLAGLRFRKQIASDVIVDGGILTRHLTVTEDMTVKLLSVHKILAVDIDANNIVADSGTIGTLRSGILIADAVTTSALKADAITSKHTITGATFQTTTTANRGIKWTSTGLKMWDSTGIQTMDLNAATGYATITGRLRTAADGNPGAVLIPPAESDDGKTMALWFTPDVASLPGGVTAGVYMSNPATSTTTGQVNIRGQQYGGIRLWDAVQFDTNTGSLPQFFSNHISGLQATAYNGNLYLSSSGNEVRIASGFNTVINVGSAKYLNLLRGGAAYSATISNAANLFLQTDGNVFKSTSASKFKILPEVMALDDRLLDEVAVKDWIDKGSAERYADSFNQPQPWTEQQTREFQALSINRVPGAIAEDVVAAGGEAFVGRDLDGELESLMYERLALARTEILKHRVAEQAAEILELRSMFEEMRASLTA